MKDNLTIRKVDGEWVVMTVLTGVIYFTGTKRECEEYLEEND